VALPALTVPAAQVTGVSAGSAHAAPAGQGVHEESPEELANWPDAHGVHVCWLMALNVPAGQAIGVCVGSGQREPAGHDRHAVSPASEYEPLKQAMGAEAAVEHANPAGQVAQLVCCGSAKVPGAQGAGASEASGHAWLAGQGEHEANPEAEAVNPGAHAAHTLLLAPVAAEAVPGEQSEGALQSPRQNAPA
jgi:hypothetical protein